MLVFLRSTPKKTYLKDIDELHHIGMTLALFEKTDFSRTVHSLGNDFDCVFRTGQSVNATTAHAEAAVAQNGLF